MKRSRWLLISTGGIALLAAATLLWWSSSSPKPVATTTPVAPTDTMASFEPKHVVQAKAVAAAPRPVMAAVSAEGGATPAAPWRAAFDGFKAWAEEFSSAPPAARQAWLAEGEKLAKARHQEMVRLIQEDPERALAEALPYRTRKAMPASLAGYLERSISGHGDFKVIEASLLPGQTGELPPTEYLVTLRKSMYRAYTYGVRMHQPSHKHIPMHGITLTDERGRKIMALGAEALRVVEPEEAKDVVAAGKVQAASTCPVCGATTVDAPQLTVADMGGEYVSFDNPQHAEVYSGQVNQALAKSWVSLGASPKDLAAASDNELFPAIPPLSHTGGRKGIMRLLMMPVMFSDDPVPPGTQDGLQGVCAGNAQTYKENSYGSVNWLSTVTPILHLPQRKAAYADGVAGGTPASVLGDGLAMARSLGYVDSYDDAYVLFNSLSPVLTFGGRSDGLLNGSAGALSHELGHSSFGWIHANYLDLSGKNPGPYDNKHPVDPDSALGHDDVNAPLPMTIGKPQMVTYGDPYDIMGSSGGHFGVIFKNEVNWLTDEYIRFINSNQTNRVYAFDVPRVFDGRLYALRIHKDYDKEYWVSHRQGVPSNPWMTHGVELQWRSVSAGNNTLLLDSTYTTYYGKTDNGITIGRTFADPPANIYITPVAEGGGSGTNKWVDVVVNVGPFPTNLPPVVSLAASATQVSPGDVVTFTASVQDPNGDTLAFNWDFGDQTFGPNAPVVTNSWATQGQYVVRCEVSDMKGGFASAYVLMVVGTPSVHTISGRVTDIFGNPLQGVRVHNGAAMPATPPPVGEGGNVTNQPVSPTSYRYAYTDSQGNYTIGNIPPGTYSCGAFVYGYKTEALFFNPVDITGADAGGFDYLATPITRLMVQNIQDAPENGLAPDGSTNSGIFRITRDGDLSKDMPVLYRTDGTAVMGTNTTANYPPWDGNWWTNVVKKGNDYITNVTMSKVGRVVILAGQASVDLAVTAIDNTNGNGNQSVIMTLLLATNDFRLTPYLTNVVTTNYLTPGDTNSPFYLVTNSEVHYVTTEVRIPGWELLPSGAEGTLTWFQTDPTYVLSNEDATVWILDDDPPNLPTVSVSAIGDTASKTYNDHGMFMFTRNNAPMTNDLTIYFSVSGSASNGYDYMALPSQVTIKAGESFALLPVEAISSKFVTASETLTINLIPSDTYLSPRGNVTGYPFFSDTDFLDQASLVEKLTSQGDPVSQFLWTNFAEASQQVLSDTNAAAQDQTTVLVDELNNIVFGPSIYESNRFLGVPLSPITRALLAQNPKGYSLMCLNRLLLEDAYPEEIAKSGISFQGGAATLTILSDNLPRVIIYASDSIAFKTGDPGRVTVSRTGDLTDPLAVNYHVSGSAVSGRDFQPLSQRVTIPAGSLTADIVITPINNTIAGVRSVVIQLADSVSYNIEYQDTATVTIQEALPTVTLKANGDAAEGGTSNTFTVTRTGPVTNSLTVYFAVGGSAVEGSDYSPVGTNLVIPVGSNSANILISPRSDSFHEYGDIFGDETVIIQLQAGTNYNLGDPSGGTIHIGDKNPNSDPEVGFMLQGSTVREDVGTVYVLVKCSANPPTNAPINFDYQVIGGTGVQGVNYQLGMWMGTNTLVVAIGTNGVTTNAVPIVGVGRFTHYRQPNPLPDMVSPEDTIGYIPVQIMSDGVSAGNKTVQLRLVPPTGYQTNYPIQTNIIQVQGHSVTNIFTNAIVTHLVTNAYFGDYQTHTITIVDIGVTTVSVVADIPVAYESGQQPGRFVITREGPTNSPLTVTYAITGDAAPGNDYVALSPTGRVGTITIPAGTNQVALWVTPNDDPEEELAEIVELALIEQPGYAVAGGYDYVTIISDDGTVQFTWPQYSFQEHLGLVQLTVVRSGDTNRTTRVDYVFIPGTALPTSDYLATNGTLVFAPGQSRLEIPLMLVDDSIVEPNKFLTVVLTNATGGVPLGGQSLATVTIVDDDTGLQFSTNIFAVSENDTNGAMITLTRTGLAGIPASVTFFTMDGTATNGVGYSNVTVQVDFAAGVTNQTVWVPIIDNNLFDGTKTVRLVLSNPTNSQAMGNVSLGTVSNATLNILDDECKLTLTVTNVTVWEYVAYATLTVSRLGGTINPVSVDFYTYDGTATNGLKYVANSGTLYFSGDAWLPDTSGSGQMQFHPGQTSATISVQLIDNTYEDGHQYFNVGLSNAQTQADFPLRAGATVLGAVTNATVMILDNELPGNVDYEYTNPSVASPGANDRVYCLALQADGMVVLGGDFTRVDGSFYTRIARMQTAGAVDLGFNEGFGANATVYALAVQPDSRILMGGAFTSVGGVARAHVARLNANGSLDTSFNTSNGPNAVVRAFGVQQDGRVIVGGDFTQVGSTPRNRLARLVGTNGVLETGFAPSFNNSVFAIAVQTDGKILAGGLFTSVNNANVSFLARLNSDGTLDTNFNNGAGLNGAVNAIALQSDGSILVAGGFTQAGGTNRNYMARLNGQGMLDATFDPGLGANGPVEAMGLAANGRILIGGDFSTYGGKSRNHVARLNSNGAVDLFFDPGTGPNSVVRALVVQPDTAVIIGGDFTSVNSIARNHIARLHGDENSNLIGVNFALATYTVAEDAGSALITVVRSGKTNLPCVIQYSTTDGTASNSVDYIGVTNSLSFALGQVSNSFSVRILDDGLAAGDKSLNLSLASTAPNVDVSGLSSAILVILDKEKYVKFSLTNYVAWENSANAIINLVRGGGLSSTAAVTFVTSGGTAVPGSNYVSVSNVVVFAAGQSNQTVLIPLIDDIIVGGDKTVGLRLTNAVNCVLLEPSNAVLHILDNDVPYATFNYSNPAAITILDASAASPYPSVINVSSLFGVVAKATVTLVNVNHTFPSDIQVLLVGPGGQTNVLLMSDAGSHYGLVNTTLQFDDTALGNLPASAPIVSDTYRPTDYPPTETFPPGAPTPPYGPVLSVLNGMIPNGTWSLYVMDAHGSDSGIISNGWQLAITTADPNLTNDLAVGMTASPDPVMAGQILDYVLSVTNNGPLAATGVTLTDKLPAGATYVDTMVSEEGSSAYSNGVVICTVGTMGVGSVATVTNRVIPTQSGLMTNTVVTSSHQTDLNPVNSTPTVVTRVLEAVGADLTLNLSASPEPVAGGQVITYTLTVSNRGPGVATNVMVTNFLSSGVQLLLATVSQGTYYQVGSNLIFPVGNLAASGSFSAVILGRTLAAGTITNTASVGSDTQDVTPDNTMTVVSHVLVAADLKLVVVAPAYAGLSGQVAYMLTVANKGPNDVTNVTLFDTLPSQFGFVSASNSQGSFVNSGNLLVFNLGTILSGSQASAMITAAPITVGVFTNQASVISELMDPDPSNNMISSATTVSSGSSGGSSNGIIVVRNTDAATLASIVTAAGSMGIQVTSSRLQANTIGNGAASSGLYYIGVPPYTYNLTVPGIILSTGDVMDYQTGPNLSSAKTTGYGIKATSEQQALLDPITGSGTQHYSHYDVTQLDIQFDMLPGFNQVKFNVVFGSEEYPFYVHSSFIDGFGIYLNGVNIAYTDGLPVNINHPAMTNMAGTELNGVLAPGGDPILTFTAPVEPGSTGNKLTFIVADTSDSVLDTTVYVSSLQGAIGPHADLAVSLTATPNPVLRGSNVTFTASVNNLGPDTATAVVLTNVLPVGLGYVSAATSQGGYSFSNGTVFCQLGMIEPNQSATVSIVATVTGNAGVNITNSVGAASELLDLAPGNSVASNVLVVVDPALHAYLNSIVLLDAGPAAVYPAIISISNLAGIVIGVTATLADLSHTYPSDLDILLVGPQGQSVILMGNMGGGKSITNVTLTFDDTASALLPSTTRIASGTYKPTDAGAGNPFYAPAPPGPYGSAMSVFNGSSPNGAWKLFIMDDHGGDAGFLAGGWRIAIQTGQLPALTITRAGSKVTLAWPDTLVGYLLESRQSMSPSGTWVPVNQTVNDVGGFFTVTLDASSGAQFFRLHKP